MPHAPAPPPVPPGDGKWKLRDLRKWASRAASYLHTNHLLVDGPVERVSGGKRVVTRRDRRDYPQFYWWVLPGAGVSGRKLRINPGYVIGPFDEGDNPNSPPDKHLPQIARHPFDCYISGTPLWNSTPPTLTLTSGTINRIYLDITWKSVTSQIGGVDFPYDSDYAFEAVDGTGASLSTAAFTPIARRFYYISDTAPPTFTVSTVSQHPTEGENVENLLAGVITLDADGKVVPAQSIMYIEGGPVYAPKPPFYRNSLTTTDRSEPVAPTAPPSSMDDVGYS